MKSNHRLSDAVHERFSVEFFLFPLTNIVIITVWGYICNHPDGPDPLIVIIQPGPGQNLALGTFTGFSPKSSLLRNTLR